MDGIKRSHDLQKVRYNGKVKENSKTTSSRNKLYDSPVSENDGGLTNLPIVRQADNARLLPRYTAVFGRNLDDSTTRENTDGVKMEDLDQLQQDLEKLLSTCAVRHRILKTEIENIDQKEERRENKKGKPVDKQPPLKRKRIDERIKYRDARNGIRLLKPKRYNLSLHNGIVDLQHKEEIPKVTIPKNDTSDKFWLSIEPYCADVTKDDLVFLEELIKECSQQIEIKVPEKGDHYTVEWLEEVMNQEQNLSSGIRNTKHKSMTLNHELKKNGINAMVETFSSPFTQRLLAALIEEKVMTKLPAINDKSKASPDVNINVNTKSPSALGACLDNNNRIIKKEEKELSKLHFQNVASEDDILQEIRKCQQELETVNAHNVTELKKLKAIVEKDIRRQEVKLELDKLDNQVLEMYNKILVTKQKQISADEDEGFDKALFHKQHHTKEFENEANTIIKQQMALIQEFNELSNFAHLY